MQSARRVPALLVLVGLTACSGSKSAQMLPTDSMFDETPTPSGPGGAVDTGLAESDDGGSGGDNPGGNSGSGDDGGGSGADGSGGESSGGSDDGGDSGADPAMMAPDFVLEDLNPSSLTYGQPVSPRDVLTQVSGWYFTHAT